MRPRHQAEMDALVRSAGFEKLETLISSDGIFHGVAGAPSRNVEIRAEELSWPHVERKGVPAIALLAVPKV